MLRTSKDIHGYSSLYSITILICCLLLILSGCSSRKIVRVKNIPYLSPSDSSFHKKKHSLDIYYSREIKDASQVVVFIHGGAWRAGSKNYHKAVGKRMAEHGKVAVLVNYRTSKRTQAGGQASDCGNAMKWIVHTIDHYHGKPSSIIVSGHSAGGHLAALMAFDSSYLSPHYSSLKGVILIDAFGLNMNSFLKTSKHSRLFQTIFSKDTTEWNRLSPVTYLHAETPPILQLVGEKTWKPIQEDNEKFAEACKGKTPSLHRLLVKRKGHLGMIFQFRRKNNPLYKQLMDFMTAETGG